MLDGVSGAGKSTIIEAIIWCLYGMGRADNRSLVRKNQAKASVVLELGDEIKSFKIERTISDKGKHDVKVFEKQEGEPWTPTAVNGVKNLQSFIEKDIIGCSYLLFINSIAYAQDNQESFIRQTAVRRKEIILEIIRAENYDKYYEDARGKESVALGGIGLILQEITKRQDYVVTAAEHEKLLETLKLKKVSFEADLATAEKKLEDAIRLQNNSREAQLQLEHCFVQTKSVSERFSALQRETAGINAQLQEAATINITQLKSEAEEATQLEAKVKELNAEESARADWVSKRILIVGPHERDFKQQIALLNQRIIEVQKANVPCPTASLAKCPVCCVLHESSMAKQIEHLVAELEQVAQEEIAFTQAQNIYLSQLALLGPEPVVRDGAGAQAIRRRFDILAQKGVYFACVVAEERLKHIPELTNRFEEKTKELAGLQAQAVELAAQREKLTAQISADSSALLENVLRAEKTRLTSDLQQTIAATASEETILEHINKAKVEMADLVEKEKKLRYDIEALGLIKKAFGANGIKAMLVDYVVPQLEDKINKVLSLLSDFRVILETQKDSVSGDKTIEGLFITIVNGEGETFDIANYSGGEKIKINTAISEGLADLQRVGFRLWDENIINFDSETIDSFIQVMGSIQNRFSQLLCVSHIQQVKDMFQDVTTIQKTSGVSAIV